MLLHPHAISSDAGLVFYTSSRPTCRTSHKASGAIAFHSHMPSLVPAWNAGSGKPRNSVFPFAMRMATRASARHEGVGTVIKSCLRGSIAMFRDCADESPKEESGLDEWLFEERLAAKDLYEFNNVMWIEWENGIAYRKALGIIVRDRP